MYYGVRIIRILGFVVIQLPAALYHLGVFFERGFIEDNFPKAAKLYHAASRQGHPIAQHNLAVFFENGFGGWQY